MQSKTLDLSGMIIFQIVSTIISVIGGFIIEILSDPNTCRINWDTNS